MRRKEWNYGSEGRDGKEIHMHYHDRMANLTSKQGAGEHRQSTVCRSLSTLYAIISAKFGFPEV